MDSQIKFAISSPVIVMIIMKVLVGFIAVLAISSLKLSDDKDGLPTAVPTFRCYSL